MLRRRISKAGVVLALALACGTSAHAESSLDAVPERRRTVAELSDPYFTSGSLIVVARDSRLGTLGEAAGRKVAVVKGSVQEADVAELQPRAILITVGSLAAGAHAVRSGQADAFLYDDVAVLALARRDPALRVTGAPIRPRAYVAAARKEDTGLIRWVNGWLATMRRDCDYQGLWRRYFTPFESHLVGA